jgi:hypothetical protein
MCERDSAGGAVAPAATTRFVAEDVPPRAGAARREHSGISPWAIRRLRFGRVATLLVTLVLVLFGAGPAIAAGEEPGGCEEGSTPGLVVTAVNTITGANAGTAGDHGAPAIPLRFTLTAQTDKQGTPHATLVFPQGIAEAEPLVAFEIHRLFIKDESHETLDSSPADGGCGDDGGCDGGDDGCGGEDDGCDDDHGEMIGAGIRGLGTLADGTQVRVHIDLQDRGPDQDIDRFRIRWRPNQDHGPGEGGGCPGEGGWLYSSGWVTVKRVDIHQK